MKLEEINQAFADATSELFGKSLRDLRRMLARSQERLDEIVGEETRHRDGVRGNDSYHLFRETSRSENALADYHYAMLQEIGEETSKLKVLSAIIPLLLEGCDENNDY